ncbi:transposase [Streptomyces sp. SID5476]|uniref:Transposase IS116/IS110/IS902 family protein n=2 Tax=Streptomyces bottropensis TaxID=42235 RepID=M3FNY1_9ACTN|nr:transposase IS116/IS110/IS902 family protein [Streptomyces bottropensis ATCC 25435]MZD17813.1 transposase [Streptomyces sp. SID5476]
MALTRTSQELLVTVGETPGRLRSEAAFAMLCGFEPLPASSGRTQRHRLNQGGDQGANSALYRIVLCRLRWDERTKHSTAPRSASPRRRSSAVSSGTSPARSTRS